MKKRNYLLSLILACVMCFGVVGVATASEISIADSNAPVTLSMDFVKNAEYSVAKDESGNAIITLSGDAELIENNQYAIKSAIILPDTIDDADNLIDNIKTINNDNIAVPYSSGTLTEDDWFFGSSVYLESTLYYTTFTDGLTYGGLDKVDIAVRTKDGSTISAMTLTIGQIGYTYGGGLTTSQTKEYDALTRRTFTPPTSWKDVLWRADKTQIVGATICATAKRSSGSSSTFCLYNNILGDTQ